MARILVIDDDGEARTGLKRILAADGHEVAEAADGSDALRRFIGHPTDVVFTDIFMPRMSGLDFMMQVRETFPDAPIIAMSGGGQMVGVKDVLQAARALGAVATLAKPLTRDSVRDALERALAED